jgi:tetratricopeptide (TPR) repeat protein
MDNNSVVDLADRARACLVSGRLEEAKGYYQRLCDLDPKNEENWLALAALHGEGGQLDEALSCVKKAVKLDEGYVEAHLTRAHLLARTGETEGALESALKAVEIDDEYAEAWLFLAGLAGRLKRYENAETWALKAVTLMGGNADALANLGSARYELSRYAQAEASYREALRHQADHFPALLGLAKAVAAQQRYAEAIDLLQPALKRAPEQSDALDCLANCHAQLGRDDEARKILEQIIEKDAAYSYAPVHLAGLLERRGDHLEAIRILRRARDVVDNPLTVLGSLAQLYYEYGFLSQAIEVCEAALELDCGNSAARFFRALSKSSLGHYEEALAELVVLRNDFPDDPKILSTQAGVLEKLGKYDQARRIIEPFLERGRMPADILTTYAQMCHRLERYEEGANLINDALQDPNLSVECRRSLLFSLGRIYERLRDYDRAFASMKAANELKPYHYHHERFAQDVDRLIDPTVTGLATDPKFQVAAQSAVRPVFIVGMMRSGTSLVEQIIASHPRAFGGGERQEIPSLVQKLPFMPGVSGDYPGCLAALTPEMVHEMRKAYASFTESLPAGVDVFTDKMTANFLHLIFIRLLFPEARIIHCVRNPLDTCLSIYSLEFTGYHDYAYDLSSLGKYYREYDRLMRHYRDEVGFSMLEVSYEDLVNDVEAWSRKIIAYCGLEWNDRCLYYYESDRVARTASYDQVRQPIYKDSLGRWKNYEPHLKPLLDELQGLL